MTLATLSHPKYRPDIDGLRAVAILSVVLYHISMGRFPGGFVGVDIFFVISGYLISLILFDNFEKDTFSYKVFYTRRILRIFPALCVVMLFVLIAGWLILLNDDYKLVGKHVAGGAAFILNFILSSEAGYFDVTAINKPLQHLWSLGVEEQFYIIWPILIGLLWKRKPNFLVITLVIATLSFAFNILHVGPEPTVAFYSPISRFWELMIGGILAYLVLHKPHLVSKYPNIQSILGVVALCAGFILINDHKEFPGYWALMPCTGAFFMISAYGSWINRKVMSNKLLVWVGLISYPLYLWHWPLFSLATSLNNNSAMNIPWWEIKLTVILASFLLAYLTYQFIEKPIRFNEKGKSLKAIILCLILFIIGSIGYTIYKNDGISSRFPPDKVAYLTYFDNYYETHHIGQAYRDDCNFYDMKRSIRGDAIRTPRSSIDKSCYTKNLNASKAIFIWGDSHAQALRPGLENTLPKNISILQVASSACIPAIVKNAYNHNDYCQVSNHFALSIIEKEKPDIVILAQYGSHAITEFRDITAELKKDGIHRVIVMGPDPSWTPYLYKVIVARYWINTSNRISTNLDPSVFAEDKAMKKALEPSDQFEYVSLLDFFCNKNGCISYLGNNKRDGLTTFDYGHLTPLASTYLAKNLLAPLIEKK